MIEANILALLAHDSTDQYDILNIQHQIQYQHNVESPYSALRVTIHPKNLISINQKLQETYQQSSFYNNGHLKVTLVRQL